jgi:glycosyltransferase involved in cell wall biosynthesis
MRILFLTQIVPYPPDAGPKVKTWNVLRYLCEQGHQVILATFVRPEEQPFIDKLGEICLQVHAVPLQRSRLADLGYWLRSNLSGRPFLIERDDLAAMRAMVKQILQTEVVDAVHADQLSMAQFAMGDGLWVRQNGKPGGNLPSPQRVFDAHNAVWTIMERMRQTAPWYLRPVVALEAGRTKRFEGQVLDQFDHILAVAEPDRLALLQAWESTLARSAGQALATKAPAITVIPIAVDAEQLQPVERRSDSCNLVTMGTLHYPPNADGVRWFAREVFPLIHQQLPSATLTIIGKNPPAELFALQAQDPQAITVTGYVPDLTPYLEQAAALIVAVRAGGGMRVRILEAFARGVPVVTTTVGLEGIQAEPEREVLVADSPPDLARQVLRLLGNPALQSRLSENGRRLAERSYDWRVVLGKMDSIYPTPVMEKTSERLAAWPGVTNRP